MDGPVEAMLPALKLHRDLGKRQVEGLIAVGSHSLANYDPKIADLDIDRTAIRLTLTAESNASVVQLLEVRFSGLKQALSNMLRQRISKVDLKPVDTDPRVSRDCSSLIGLLSFDHYSGIWMTGRSRPWP